jgi:23S rRNA (cytosine1962-C5)-methyltransferase
MFSAEHYELLDFGAGRKLERFGSIALDRPAPSTQSLVRKSSAVWKAAARYVRDSGSQGAWFTEAELPETWSIQHGEVTLELKRTPFGHVGLFPEQAENWDWIRSQLRDRDGPFQVLNLFAYTGGTTLAAAAEGVAVTHVDAARNIVDWARRNAQRSGLEGAAIRWIVEDARKFVERELRRGRRYDAVVLDPPSYGHGPKGQTWRIDRDLVPLLKRCRELTPAARQLLLLTCHSPQWTPRDAARLVQEAGWRFPRGSLVAQSLCLTAKDGRQLPSGIVVRGST